MSLIQCIFGIPVSDIALVDLLLVWYLCILLISCHGLSAVAVSKDVLIFADSTADENFERVLFYCIEIEIRSFLLTATVLRAR